MNSIRYAFALIIALLLSADGYRKGSLCFSGTLAAFVVGFLSFACSVRFGVILILFYLTSSKLTKMGKNKKEKLEADYAVSSSRNYVQVFANSVLATVVALAYLVFVGEDTDIRFPSSCQGRCLSQFISILSLLLKGKEVSLVNLQYLGSVLQCMYLAHYACTTADTWASEVGILSKSPPRMITSLLIKEVPPGTNGGVSVLGLVASGVGGGFIGIIHVMFRFIFNDSSYTSIDHVYVIIFCAICGLTGSIIDSLLGAVFQASYYCRDRKCIVKEFDANSSSISNVGGYNILSNDMVNFLSIAITMMLSIVLGPLLLS